jgi:glycosyltransferase involved in cell wall biosynthesis
MRILHILEEIKPSGAEAMLQAAAPYWREQGFESDILSVGNTLGAYAPALEKSGYRIHHIQFSPSCAFLRSVLSFLKRQRYDAIHIHLERANFWYALLAYISGTRKLAYSIHGTFLFRRGLRIERCIQRWIMRSFFGVKMVSISPSVERNEREKFSNDSILIPNWFDSTKYKPPSMEERYASRYILDIPDDVTTITSVGGCWSYKNHSAIIKAIAGLSTNSPIVYLHVGQEAEGYPERKLAEMMGASNRVRFLGIVPDVLPILYASDVYIMPSIVAEKITEGFGVAAMEAMGAGLPAILSDVPGLCDFRDGGEDIYWAEPISESLARAIQHFRDVPASERREMGLRLSSYVHRHFAVEKGAGAYARLYQTSKDKQV